MKTTEIKNSNLEMKTVIISKECDKYFSQILQYTKYNTSSEFFCSVEIAATSLNTAGPTLPYIHSWQTYF